jgi:hypothetical protein
MQKDRLTTGLNFLQCHPEQREDNPESECRSHACMDMTEPKGWGLPHPVTVINLTGSLIAFGMTGTPLFEGLRHAWRTFNEMSWLIFKETSWRPTSRHLHTVEK